MNGASVGTNTQDVSLGGMSMELAIDSLPAVGAVVAVELPRYGVSAQGVVKWSRELQPGRVLVGVSFVHLAVEGGGIAA
jgi:hypothetical protein